jgi:N-acyl homoserine lactone hydrolase
MNTSIRRLYLMQVATLPGVNSPIVCYLVQTEDGTNILIDSGLAPNTEPPPGAPNPIMGANVIEQLAQIGIKPADIRLFIATHFDPDHAGNNDLFPAAEFIVQRGLYEDAQTSPRAARSRDHWGKPNLKYRCVDGDTVLLPGLELIETSGHVPGHQSVLVRLPKTGNILLAIDAVMNQKDFTPDREGARMDADPDMARTSTRKLIDLAARENAALVIFGHDGQQWDTLHKLPEFYE